MERVRRRVLAASVALVVGAGVAACGVFGSSSSDGGAHASRASSSPSASPHTVDALRHGAVGDGRTDDTRALQRALKAMRPGQTLVLDSGHTFAVSGDLTITVPRTTITGGGTLLATDEQQSSLVVDGSGGADGVTLSGITLAIKSTTKRWEGADQQRLRVDGGSGLAVRDVTIDGSAAAGVFIGGQAHHFVLDDVTVRDTRADGIHMTDGAYDGVVRDPHLSRTGDDGVAVVSYAHDGVTCHDILVDGPVVRTTTGGRGLSVVGGTRITYRDIDVDASAAAAVYIASEGGYDTEGIQDVDVEGGTVTHANQDAAIDHGAVLVYDGTSRPIQAVDISDLTISGTRATASRQVGVLDDGGGPITGVELDRLRLQGPPKQPLVADSTALVRTTGWTQDGAVLPNPFAGAS